MIGGKATRDNAIPYRAMWYDSGMLGNFGYFGDLWTDGAFQGDWMTAEDREVGGIATTRGYGSRIRLTRPYKGDIIQAKLTMEAVNGTGTTTVRLYKGDFASDGVFAASSYGDDRISADHKALTGMTTPFTLSTGATLFIDGLDILYIIPSRNDSDFNEDGFVLGVEVVSSDPAGWELKKFKVDCTVQLAEKRVE